MLKDWKKTTYSTTMSTSYYKGNKIIDIVRIRQGIWEVHDPQVQVIAKTNTKSQALKYAKAYMRKH